MLLRCRSSKPGEHGFDTVNRRTRVHRRRFDQFGGLLSWTQASAAKARDVAAFTTTLDAASTSMEAAKEAAALPTRERDESHGYEGSS